MNRADQVFAFINRHMDETGYVPDNKEIATAIGVRAAGNEVTTTLRKLHRQDRITTDRNGILAVAGREPPRTVPVYQETRGQQIGDNLRTSIFPLASALKAIAGPHAAPVRETT